MTFCWFFSEARSKLLASLAEFSIFGSERPADYRGRMFSVFAVLTLEGDIAQMFLLPSALVSLIDAAERGFLVLLMIIDKMRKFNGSKKEMSGKNIFW